MKFKKIAAFACAVTIAAAGAAGIPAVSEVLGFDNPIKASAEVKSQNGAFSYDFNDDGTIYIIKCYAPATDPIETLTLPAKIDGYTVSAVGTPWGSNSSSFSILEHSSLDFNGANLRTSVKTLYVSEGISTLNKWSLTMCEALETVYLPSTLKKIDRYAFAFDDKDECNLKDIYFEKGDVEIIDPFNNGSRYTISRSINFHVYHNSGAEKYALEYNQWIDDNPQSMFNNKKKINIIYREDETVYGDLNRDGSIDFSDLGLLQRHLCDWKGLDIDLDAADVNLDGVVDFSDLGLMQRYLCDWGIKLGTKQ